MKDLLKTRPYLEYRPGLEFKLIDFTSKEKSMGTYKEDNFVQIVAESSDIDLSPYQGTFLAKFSKGYIIFREESRDMDGSGEDCYGVNYTSPNHEYKFLIIND